jgi:DNA-binding transcriptional ArsR family regulator
VNRARAGIPRPGAAGLHPARIQAVQGIDIYFDICLNMQMPATHQSVFKALADPTRRAILKRLQDGSETAGDIADAFPISRPSLSHHFNILKAADLVRTERRGQHIVYSLNATVLQETTAMLLDIFTPSASKDKRTDTEEKTK